MEPTGNTQPASSNPNSSNAQRKPNDPLSGALIDDIVAVSNHLNGSHPSSTRSIVNIALMTLALGICILLGVAIGMAIVVYRGPNVYVRFKVDSQDIGEICANAIVKQQNELIVYGPAVILVNATIFSQDTGTVFYPLVESYELSVPGEPEVYTIRDVFSWKSPDLPPARYLRVTGAATYRASVPAIATTYFTIKDCDDGASKP